MKCPKCGYHRQKGDDDFVPASECPACGIVYLKHIGDASTLKEDESEQSETVLRPSPVDAESLKKARERVEKRINDRIASKSKDKRHDQTLQLARRLASEGVRKRQAQWQEQLSEKTAQAEDRQGPEAPTETEPTQQKEKKSLELNHPDAQMDIADDPQTAHTEDCDIVVQDTDDLTQDTALQSPQKDDNKQADPARNVTSVARAMERQEVEPTAEDAVDVQNEETIDPSAILYMEEGFGGAPAASWSGHMQEAADNDMDLRTAPLETETRDRLQESDKGSATGNSHQRKRWRWVPGDGLSRLLPLVAWLILLAGLSGAVLSWTTMTEAEAGMQTQQLAANSSMPLGLLLGFAYLVTGVLGFAFFWVSSLISRQLKDIRNLLLLQPMSLNNVADVSTDGVTEAFDEQAES